MSLSAISAAVLWPFSERLRGASEFATSARLLQMCDTAAARCERALAATTLELAESSARGHAAVRSVLAAAPRRALERGGGWRLVLTVAAAEQLPRGDAAVAAAVQALLLSQALQAVLPLASRAFPGAAAGLEATVAAALGGVDVVAALSPSWIDALRGMLVELQVRSFGGKGCVPSRMGGPRSSACACWGETLVYACARSHSTPRPRCSEHH